MSTHVLVRSETIRDFDDIYEGEVPEIICTHEELKKELIERFEIRDWEIGERNDVTGYKKDGSVRVEFIVGDEGNVQMLTITDAPKESVEKLRDELDLKILD